MKDSWILVTGAAGFIGSHLRDYLLDRGERVLAVDNFVTGHKRNVSHLLENKDFELLEADIVQPIQIKHPVKQVYNLASPASPRGYMDKPLETMLVSSFGVKHMLDLALQKKARFLQASTSEVYGDPLEHPQTESYSGNVSPIGPRSCYDEGKRFAEALVMVYRRQFALETRIARIFNTYGPRMDVRDGRVVPNFISQALKGRPMTVYGSGIQTRSFCYVTDMVEGLYRLMNSVYVEPVNLGNPDEYTMAEFAEKIKRLTKSGSRISFQELPQDDPTRRKPDISTAKRVLGWEPAVSLEEGLQKTVAYFEGVL